MKLTQFAVKNYQFTVIIFLLVMALGYSSLMNMPRSEDPSFEAPIFSVVVIYPGTSPKDIEELVIDPIEEKISELENIKKIVSESGDGLAAIRVEFKYEEEPNAKYEELIREVNALRPTLPEGIFDIKIIRFNPEDVNIAQIALKSETASYKELQLQGEELKRRLIKVKAIKKVELHGNPKLQVRISLHLDRMAQHRIPLSRVFQAIQSENLNIPGGAVEIGTKKLNVKTSGAYESLDEIRNTVIGGNGQSVIYLRDLADVSFDTDQESYKTRLNGQRCIFVVASQKGGNNIFATGEKIEPIFAQFAKDLPAHITFEQNFDQVKTVRKRLFGLAEDFGIAILLVLLTLIPLGFRAAVIVMISIPLSLSMGLASLDYLGFSINQLSIVGLVVALGLLVDDSIVVVENIERWMRLGHDRTSAAIKGTQQIFEAVIGCTAVLIFAFLPLAFLPEASGDFIRGMPMAVILTIVASLLVSLTIVPFLAALLLPKEAHAEGNWALRMLKKGISGSYRKMLNVALAHPAITLVIAGLIFAGSLTLIPVIGFSLFPKSEKPQFLVQIETPLGSSLAETDRATRWVENILAKTPKVTYYASNVGKGNPRIYYNVLQRNQNSAFAEVFVLLEDMESEEKTEIVENLRGKMMNCVGAKIEVKEFEQGPPVEAPIAIRVFGKNLDSLRSLSSKVEQIIKNTEGTIYVNNGLAMVGTDLKIKINKDKAGLLGIPTAEIDRTVRMALAGLSLGKFQDSESNDYDISISVPRSNIPTMEAIQNLYVTSVSGALIPLHQITNIALVTSPNSIKHFDKDRYTTVTAFADKGYLTSNLNAELIKKLDAFPFPQGYRYVAAGEIERTQESFGGLGAIILITVFGILAILILEFRTFKSTFIVLSVIPLGIIGAVLILLFTGYTFSFVSIVGLIALIGIEIKNSILLVDYTNQLREGGMGLNEAIQEAGETRFVPIILTSLTAIGGLMPLALERSPLISPLAWVMIGGLISSTLLTRVVTPVLYKLLPPSVRRG